MTAATSPATEATIRPFADGDYAPGVLLGRAAFPEYPLSEDEWREGDARRDPKCRYGRLVAEQGGALTGLADWGNASGSYHPRKFGVMVMVHPEHRRRGLGARLYDRLMTDLEPMDPLALSAGAREDMPDSVAFLEKRGFVEVMRHWESHLDVAAFDPAPFRDEACRASDAGVVVTTYADLAEDPDRDAKFYELTMTLMEDVPSPEPHTRVPFDVWRRRLTAPGFVPEANFIARDGEAWVGHSGMSKSAASDHLFTGLTGVTRDYRRKGIALALKLRAIEYAKTIGAPVIRTGNATTNEGMLALNARLGFVKQPAWINYAKVLKEETEEEPKAA